MNIYPTETKAKLNTTWRFSILIIFTEAFCRYPINTKKMNKIFSFLLASILLIACSSTKQTTFQKKPNILWIIAEDLSPFMGCYDDPINSGHTPNIDQLASEGVLFKRAYSTAPVCSASRSAIITGVMQTTTGTHQHRSSRTSDGEIVPEELRIHLPKHIKTIPELMKAAGYFTFNNGKDDYNFHYDRTALYAIGSADNYKVGLNGWQGNRAQEFMSLSKGIWKDRPDKEQPWFGQVQIMGGKRDAKYVSKEELLSDNDVPIPAYFPDIPSQRQAWTTHYNANRGSDVKIKEILAQLEADGELNNTIIFFFSDHGSNTSMRHKQFCYEGGMHVPLMIKGNHVALRAGTVRTEMVSLLDVSATTLSMAGVKLPEYLDGQNLFASDYNNAKYIMGARDRCDYTIDKIRTVRSDKYRYIRNYHLDRPMLQAGYRDNKPMVTELKKAKAEGTLTAYQKEHWFGTRPQEELYDLATDPHQMNNLAGKPKFESVLLEHRTALQNWIAATGDKGQYPESAVQLKATYDLWIERPIFKDAEVNPEYDQFRN